MTKCEICGNTYKQIKGSHLKLHNITLKEYLNLFPNCQLLDDEIKDKISGENNPFYGKHHTKEAKQKNREKHLGKLLGENNPSKRIEVREKISSSKIGHDVSEDTKLKISNTKKGCIPWNKDIPMKESSKNKMRKENNYNWKGGTSFKPYCWRFNKLLKKQIRERDNRICQLCGKTEEENHQKLSVHHIHYDKENCYPDLISLCCICNSKVNFNREYYEEFFMNKLKEKKLLNYFGEI